MRDFGYILCNDVFMPIVDVHLEKSKVRVVGIATGPCKLSGPARVYGEDGLLVWETASTFDDRVRKHESARISVGLTIDEVFSGQAASKGV